MDVIRARQCDELIQRIRPLGGTEQSERSRLVGHDRELPIQNDAYAFLSLPRHHAYGGCDAGCVRALDRNVVRPRAARTNQQWRRGRGITAETGVECCADRHRRLRSLVHQHQWTIAEPGRECVENPLAGNRRRKEPAVEQDRVRTDHVDPACRGPCLRRLCRRDPGGAGEKRGKVPGHRGIALVWQSELAQAASDLALRTLISRDDRQELAERREHLLACQLGRHRAAYDASPAAQHRHRHALWALLPEQPLLRGAALPAKGLTLGQAKPYATGYGFRQLALDEGGKCQVNVVAAKQEVLAARDSLERDRTCRRGCAY